MSVNLSVPWIRHGIESWLVHKEAEIFPIELGSISSPIFAAKSPSVYGRCSYVPKVGQLLILGMEQSHLY